MARSAGQGSSSPLHFSFLGDDLTLTKLLIDAYPEGLHESIGHVAYAARALLRPCGCAAQRRGAAATFRGGQ
jgi:hypothetical protein